MLALLVVGFVASLTHLTADADGSSDPATATPVVRIDPGASQASVDFVDVLSSGGFSSSDLASIDAIGTRSGAQWLTIARATIQMGQINRGSTVVKSSPPGMFFPMDSIAVEPTTVADTM
ncbi:MAG: hypothetical protein QOD72_1674, partial [Acidimicrobiaceae bacterium]|nr:hypothetical protein [Acidimicrobiaceae bacterium]